MVALSLERQGTVLSVAPSQDASPSHMRRRGLERPTLGDEMIREDREMMIHHRSSLYSRDSAGASMKNAESLRSEQSGRSEFKKLKTQRSITTIWPTKEQLTRLDRLRNFSQALITNRRFAALTATLTIYALFGDDFRLAATPKSTDVLFDILTTFCVAVFIIEVIVASLGQKEYFLGFFFLLDVVSTVSLVMDLTWIANQILCRNMNSESALKTSRASRVGARASRTMRIIRLMRMVKLYKSYRAATGTDKHDDAALGAEPGGGIEDAELFGLDRTEEQVQRAGPDRAILSDPSPANEHRLTAEMRVGRKLSDMTTRRVIVIVLVMLFCLPQFTLPAHRIHDFRGSESLGLASVYARLRSWCMLHSVANSTGLPWCLHAFDPSNGELRERLQGDRYWFERSLLAYVHAHRGHRGSRFAFGLYWIGLNSVSLAATAGAGGREEHIRSLGRLAQLNQVPLLGPSAASSHDLGEWDSRFSSREWQWPVEPLPAAVKSRLADQWQERCGIYVGVNVLSKETPSANTATSSACSIDDDLRCSEVSYFNQLTATEAESQHLTLVFVFDLRGRTQFEAMLSMLQTCFVCLAVGLGAMSFSKDANEILLDPIERMMTKVAVVRENPLAAIRLGDLEYSREEQEQHHNKQMIRRSQRKDINIFHKMIQARMDRMKKPKEPMETVMLERTILKLGRLLALCFGEAGAAIVNNGLGHGTVGLQENNAGERVDAAMGICRVRHFPEALEVLHKDITIFVNQVCEIVHACVDDLHGAPIRNTGDAFVLIWRFTGVSPGKHAKLSDMAMLAFIRITVELNRSRAVSLWRRHPGLLHQRKHFVDVGVGLHRGWAIEGTIGSEFKVDASYLSPNILVAWKLESMTMHYGVWILVSEPFIKQCSQEMAGRSRAIDYVTIKRLDHPPVRLYTFDLDCTKVKVQPKKHVLPNAHLNPFKVRQLREARKKEIWSEDLVRTAFERDKDLQAMRSTYSAHFFRRFSMAFRNYEAGEWRAARDMFLTCHYTPKFDMGQAAVGNSKADWPVDGPTVALLSFMGKNHYSPPGGWTGYHELP